MHRLGIIALVAIVGCSSESGRVPVHPTKGTVTAADGTPAEGALVFLNPVAPNGGPTRPNGRVAADGSFVITSYKTGDGAPAGEYAVTIVWPLPKPADDASDDSRDGPDRLKGRFADPGKPVRRVTITADPNVLEPISLK